MSAGQVYIMKKTTILFSIFIIILTTNLFSKEKFKIKVSSLEVEKTAANEKLQRLRAVTGSFLRYPSIASALRYVTHSSAWYIAQDMKHETKDEFEEARNNVINSFEKLIRAIDEALKSAPRKI